MDKNIAEMINDEIKVEEQNAIQQVTPSEDLPLAVDSSVTKPKEIVDGLFNQAIGHVATTDKQVQVDILETSKGFIKNKIDAIKNDVEKESKTAFFENNEDACGCYGYEEKTTPKYQVKIMRVAYNIISTIYILLASVSVMPIVFLIKKISVVIKKTWIAIILSIMIWLGTVLIPILVPYLTNIIK